MVVGHYRPEFFLTDLEVTYDEYKERAGLTSQHLRDIVHLKRQAIRLFDDAVREVTLDVPRGLPYEERKKQRALKQRLLRKRLHPILSVALRAFAPGNESVCTLMLEGVASQLQDPDLIIQTASVRRLAKRFNRLAVREGTPTTTNGLESKPFSLIAKSFRPATGQNFFAGVALMENFDVKERGIHKGSSAIQRAGIKSLS